MVSPGKFQKNGTNELICRAEIETETQRTNVWTPRGKGKDVRNCEVGTDIHTLLMWWW